MVDLETIATGVMLASIGTAVFIGIPVALGMSTYARSYNIGKRNEFLKNELGEDNLTNIHIGESRCNPKIKRGLLIPIELNGDNYLIELEHQKSSWFADLFYDTRLYDHVRLVLQ